MALRLASFQIRVHSPECTRGCKALLGQSGRYHSEDCCPNPFRQVPVAVQLLPFREPEPAHRRRVDLRVISCFVLPRGHERYAAASKALQYIVRSIRGVGVMQGERGHSGLSVLGIAQRGQLERHCCEGCRLSQSQPPDSNA